MLARIYRPTKNAMQSGKANTKMWALEFQPDSARWPDALMGWTQTTDLNGQVRVPFDTKEEAVAYAQKHNIPFQIIEPKPARRIIKAYADNFAANRKIPWTH